MARTNESGDNILDALLKVDPKVQEQAQRTIAEKQQAQNEQAHQRMGDLIGSNSTLPVTISSIRFLGGPHTRKSFLDGVFDPLLSKNKDCPYTLSEALQALSGATDKLRRFDIYKDDLSMFIDRPSPTDPSSTPSDIDVFIRATERGRLSIKTGTDVGNVEGSAYLNVQQRNLFGGAESVTLNASAGTRTRSSYQAVFDSPLLSDPDKRLSLDVLASSTQKDWSSHEEVLKGGNAKFSWATDAGSRHQLAYTGLWRQVTALTANASPTVRNDAGDSTKSSFTHTWLLDRRNHPFLPNSGYLIKTISELAGWGPLKGDVGFWKSEVETSAALSVPGIKGASLTGGFRAGVLYPMGIGFGGQAKSSRVNDRFTLGGPTDVRGFKMAGLGPRDGRDSVGGDVYAAGGINLLLPFPRVAADSPLRLQLFANAGRLLALKSSGEKTVSKDVYSTITELGNGLPSVSAGVGVVYVHPVARFELNFGLPVVVRRGEEGRKGLQFGVGLNFL